MLMESPTSNPADNNKKIKITNNFGGREDLGVFYRQMMNSAFERKFFEFYSLSDDKKTLTIANSYRMRIKRSGNLALERYGYFEKKWFPCSYAKFPKFQIFPCSKSGLDIYLNIVNLLFDELKDECMYTNLEESELSAWKSQLNEHKIIDTKKTLYAGQALQLIKDIFYQKVKKANNIKEGFVPTVIKYFLDNDLLKIMSAINYKYLNSEDYFRFLERKKDCFRIYSERKNLIPLLSIIDHKYWKELDLFSRKYWVRAKGEDDCYLKICLESNRSAGILMLQSNSELKYMLNLSSESLKALVVHRNFDFLTLIVSTRVDEKIPVYLMRYLIKTHKRIRHMHSYRFIDEVLVYKSFIRACLSVWKEKGFQEMKAYINQASNGGYDIGYVFDFLRGDTFKITKNSTWESLLSRAKRWHETLIFEENADKNISWGLPNGIEISETTEIDGYTITNILNYAALHRESCEMRHCIANVYLDSCVEGHYLAFSIINNETKKRHTLGLSVKDQELVYDQLRGRYNEHPDRNVEAVAKKFCRELAKKTKRKFYVYCN